MRLQITESYLWLPVDTNKAEVKLHFYHGEEKFQEVDIQLGEAGAGFYTAMDVSKYLGQEVEIVSDVEEELLHIFCCDEKVQTIYPFRPKMHFAPENGWINDPNGLVYADGVYHLFYQWNPYGVIWGNMHWGHAVSKDLITWEQKPMAMEPDVYGTIFSGCGFQDKENVAGYGKDALLFFYTASGGYNEWSIQAGNQHTQRLAVSLDGGETLEKASEPIIKHIKAGNRDPKVFYHEASSAYVMVLYLDENEFAIFRSSNLLDWEETQRFSVEGMWECPDLYELAVDNVEGEKKWVFWSADGYYVVGEFDGYQFTRESERKSAYRTWLPYAAQTYAGVENRVISVSWVRTENIKGNYKGMMALPAEISLRKCADGYTMILQPVRELESYRHLWSDWQEKTGTVELQLSDKPVEFVMNWESDCVGKASLTIGNVFFSIDFDNGNLTVSNPQRYEVPFVITFNRTEALELGIIIDRGIAEFFGNSGSIYGVLETEESILRKTAVIEVAEGLNDLKIYELY